MTSRILISLSLLLFAWQKACAQLAPPEDFFNTGAQLYISNNVPAALERVEDGIKTYPNDDKLKRLEQLLKQKQQQQQQQNQSQQQPQKDQQKQDQQKQQQNSPDQQKQDEEKQKQAEQQKADEQKQQEQKQQSAAQKKDADKQDKDKPETEGQPVKAGQLTPEEAKRLLDNQKGDEQLLQMKPQEKPRNPLRTVKDW